MSGTRFLRFAAATAALASGASCGGGESGPDTGAFFRDGSRLKAHWQQVPGTPKVFLGWYDTELQTDCRWVITGNDGTVRCLPWPPVGTGLYWSDAGCTVPLVSADSSDEGYIWERAPSQCAVRDWVARVFEIGGPATTSVYWNFNGPCEAVTDPTSAGPLRQRGAELPLGSLVSTGIEPSGTGRIVPLIARAIDGAWQRDEVARDTALVTDVYYSSAYGPRWYPLVSAEQYRPNAPDYFSDAACTTGVARIACTFTTHLFTGSGDLVGCDPPRPIYARLGSFVDPATAHTTRSPTSACAPAASGDIPGIRYATPGPTIPDEEFAAVSVTEIGSGPVKLRMASTTDGEAIVPGKDYYDSTHQVVCSSITAADGRSRCLPSNVGNGNLYADSTCTRRAIALRESCAVPNVVSIVANGATRVFPVLAASPSTVFVSNGTGPCVEMSPPPAFVRELGAEIPAADFVEVAKSPLY